MGQPELFLEHSRGTKRQKVLRVKPGSDLFVIGSSREADLRLSGEGINGCHAVLRFRSPHWYVCDVSGTESVTVNGEPVTESRVDATAKIEIAGHRIELFTKERSSEIFKETEVSGLLAHHQVVVRSRGRVVETRILKATELFTFRDGEKVATLPAPTTGKWTHTEIGRRAISQRLVSAQEIASAERIAVDQDLRKPLIVAIAALFLMVGSVTLLSSRTSKVPEVALDNKSMDMIFNAKTIKKKRLEAQKIQKVAKGRAGGNTADNQAATSKSSQPDESMAPKVTAKASAALTSLRNSGLGSLIGKIAKRANKQNVMVAAVGVSPDTMNSGRALFSNGTSTVGGGGSASKAGDSYRLGGIATKGKAGGVGDFKSGTALAGGSVGAGNVLALVDDEETSVEGGLDKDAIAEVIRRNLGQIRYCYERQLSSNPDLYGKVLMKWTIGAAGEVSGQRVDNSTLKSDMVEGCIMRRLAGWKFPLPKGGTQVRVSYPFLFKALD